ncbi:DUF58 domain-containing protein [Agarivorans aestuarii]|uniref:DUF58 domain-containing protein n=1 Tax=Agarivorans aestuarii TaxID=1563703 RepID=UPI001C82745D|nr:DUF58 domain-containing protein [Agarivorans aestuarii]
MTISTAIKDPDFYTDLESLSRLRYKATGFDFLPSQPINSLLTGRHVSKLRGRGLNFEEMRHYQMGDDIRTMDWKVTMRTGKPHVKIFSEERERNVYLLIDQRMSMFFGSQGKMKSVVAAELSALIAWNVIASTDRVGAIIFDDESALTVAPHRSVNHVLKLLSQLVVKNHALHASDSAASKSSSFAGFFEQAQRLVKHDGLVIIITDGYGYTADNEDAIKKLCQHNDVIFCHVTDPLEHELANLGTVAFSDGAMQVAVPSDDALFREKFSYDVVTAIASFAALARRYRIPMLKFNTIEESDLQLRAALGRKVGK